MGYFDLFRTPTLDHPRFGKMDFARDYWRCEADYLNLQQVLLMLHGTKKGIDPAAQALCDELETRFASLKDEVGKALYEESYIPVREAIDLGEYPGDVAEEISVINNPADIWNYILPTWILFGDDGEADWIEIAVRTEWEIEHTLGIGIKNWRYDYLNGSVLPA